MNTRARLVSSFGRSTEWGHDQGCNGPIQRRFFVAGSASLLAAGCRRRESARQDIRLLLAGNAASPAYLPHVIAERLQFYEAQGLQVTTDNVPGGTRGAQALIGGSADVVISFFEQPFRLAAQGQKTRAFVVMTRYPGNVLITSAHSASSIHSVQDLKHRAVGVSDLGSQNHFFLNWVLNRNGISPNDVNVVPTGSHAAALVGLQQGKLDAWSGFDPIATHFQHRYPQARILADARTGSGVRELFGASEYPGSVLYSKSGWIQRNPQAARKLARALVTSLQWIHRHTVDQIVDVVPASFIGEDRALYRDVVSRSIMGFTEDGRMPPSALELVRKVLSVSLESVRKKDFEPLQTFTNEFV